MHPAAAGFLSGIRDVYGVTDRQIREAIIDLARQSREKGWWGRS
ncbi:hypothetical protein [Streptosporangium roseum]|nr:hypothetical protein [Streptosporangium roseum]